MIRLAVLTSAIALTATAVAAQTGAAQTSGSIDPLSGLRACRGIATDRARLECFDQASRALDEGQSSGRLFVVDQAEIQDTRQRLFGLDVPNVRLLDRFGGQTQVETVQSTLSRGHQNPRGEWIFELADGSVWRQVDAERFTGRARPGVDVRVRRAAMGSYFINVDGARALRARRDR